MKQFKPIPEYSNYIINKNGKVYRIIGWYCRTLREIKPQITKDGYFRVGLYNKKGYRKIFVHKLVLLTFNPINKKLQGNHKNGIKADNRLINLEWCTAKQNMNHALKMKLRIMPKGEECSWSKLKEKDILFIRKAYKNKELNMRELAEKFNINKTPIFKIIHKENWRHI